MTIIQSKRVLKRKRTSLKETKSRKMFDRAQRYLVGGVNSPVRSFKGVERSNPLFIKKALGSKIFDEDGNRYIDYVCSWGASILGGANSRVVRAINKASMEGLSFGAATNLEVELAAAIQKSMPSLELMRFVCSGTEATMSAVRVARAFSKKDKVIKFDGCYHGHSDGFLVKAGSGLATFTIADSAGVVPAIADQTLVANYNDPNSVETLLRSESGKNISAIIVEPVAGNMGVVPPKRNFLQELRKLADDYGCLLIFDEVITGFRLGRGGAQEIFGVKPDITCLGKVIGGGMNIAAYGGRKEIMELVAPLGSVYQAGTLAGNPIAVSAGLATLEQLDSRAYRKLEATSLKLQKGLEGVCRNSGTNMLIQRVGSMLGMFFTDQTAVDNYDQVNKCNGNKYSSFFGSMLESGVYLPPSAFETTFVSLAHSDVDIEETVKSAGYSLGSATS